MLESSPLNIITPIQDTFFQIPNFTILDDSKNFIHVDIHLPQSTAPYKMNGTPKVLGAALTSLSQKGIKQQVVCKPRKLKARVKMLGRNI